MLSSVVEWTMINRARDAFFLHEMFDAWDRRRQYHTSGIRYLESLWDFSEEEVVHELESMLSDGLIEKTETGHWHATEYGKLARERRFQELGRRHNALAEQTTDLSNLLIALIASNHQDERNLNFTYFIEKTTPIYLWKHPKEQVEAALESLVDSGAVKRLDKRLTQDGIKLTPDGVIKYWRSVAPILGIHPSTTILMSASTDTPAFDHIELEQHYVNLIRYRWEEAKQCANAECWLSASVMYGSVLEMVLLSALKKHHTTAINSPKAPRFKNKVEQDIRRWKLQSLIEVATDLNIIDKGIAEYAHALRDTRNLVHPEKQFNDKTEPDSKLVDISRTVVEAVVERIASGLET
jgi:hypothetical protein